MAHEATDIRRTLLLLQKDDKILLAMKKRGFGVGLFNGVGGKLDKGENVEQAMIRETEEEIGVTPTKYQKVAELDFIQDADTNPFHMFVYAYIATKWKGEPVETEEMAPKWFKLNEIPYNKMWEDDQYWLPLVLAGERVKGTFTFDKDNHILEHTITAASEWAAS